MSLVPVTAQQALTTSFVDLMDNLEADNFVAVSVVDTRGSGDHASNSASYWAGLFGDIPTGTNGLTIGSSTSILRNGKKLQVKADAITQVPVVRGLVL